MLPPELIGLIGTYWPNNQFLSQLFKHLFSLFDDISNDAAGDMHRHGFIYRLLSIGKLLLDHGKRKSRINIMDQIDVRTTKFSFVQDYREFASDRLIEAVIDAGFELLVNVNHPVEHRMALVADINMYWETMGVDRRLIFINSEHRLYNKIIRMK